MAEINLPAQALSSAGIAPTYYDSTSSPALGTGDLSGTGDQFLVNNDGRTFLFVKNGATAATITLDRAVTVDGYDVPDRTVAVPANAERAIWPRDRNVYGSPFKFAMDDVSNLEIAVLRL